MSKYGTDEKGRILFPCEICTDLTSSQYRYCDNCRYDLQQGRTQSEIRYEVYRGMRNLVNQLKEKGKGGNIRRYL